MKNIVFNICFALNCLLLFLLLFESRFTAPAWLQVTGRMHPLMVHFPIVLIILYAFLFVVSPRKIQTEHAFQTTADLLLLIGSLSSGIAALMGLFLSREEGYDADALAWHKWGGVILSVFTLGWYHFRRQLETVKLLSYCTALVAVGIILITGHQGAAITHGENFLLAPITPDKKKPIVPLEDAIVFTDMVKPILEEKCVSCHNNKKAKGELVMESEELLLKGGKNGKLWDSTAADFGLLLQRVHLPLEQKKHMPPQGKPQLTDEELQIITRWIRKGANFTLAVADLPADDTLRLIAARIFMDTEVEQYDFEAADPETIQKLNTANRVVAAEALTSPALTVSFFNSKLFTVDQLKELSVIKKQVISLDLAKMPVEDADIKLIAEFENLRRLNLSFTKLSGGSLQELKKLKFLKAISLSGTQVNASHLKQLESFEKLKTVYAWNIPVDTIALKQIQHNVRHIRFETGFKGDTITLQLSPPLLENEEQIITTSVPLKLRHYLPGVQIRYTTDGTEPDSVQSSVFEPGKFIDSNTILRARAFKPGWIGSKTMEAMFFKHTHRPDTILFLTPPDSSFSGSSKFLTDLDKGTTNFRAGSWLAWRRKRMEVLMEYKEAVTIQKVTLSSMIDVYRFVMPPLQVEIWGGEDQDNLRLLGRMKPVQPSPMKKEELEKARSFLKAFECRVKPTTVKYIKIIGTTVSKLPAWHTGKGQMGYIFVDEVVVN